MARDKFKNSDGSLTTYAFACGYIQTFPEYNNWDNKVDLFMEHSHYHVKGYVNGVRIVWECFPIGELSQARKLFRLIKKQLSTK